MILSTKYQAYRLKAQRILRIIGLVIVGAVNAFVLLTNDYPSGSGYLQEMAGFVNHATRDHHINSTPFSFRFMVHAADLPVMDTAASLPVNSSNFHSLLLSLATIVSAMLLICFCFFRGEEDRNTQFFPAVFLPPPENL
ncbi:MAG: hypothetical protein K1X61_14235 [Chitinophagales bacterium]|nr:hypothetical protein [Chitinophagales bacterium]